MPKFNFGEVVRDVICLERFGKQDLDDADGDGKEKVDKTPRSNGPIDINHIGNLIRKSSQKGLTNRELMEVTCLLSSLFPFVRYLPLRLQKEVCKSFEFHEYPAGMRIFRQGAPSDRFFAVLTGKVELSNDLGVIAQLHASETFGELGIISDSARSATCVARYNTLCLSLRKQDYLNVFTKEVCTKEANFLINSSYSFTGCTQEQCAAFCQHMVSVTFPIDTCFTLDNSDCVFFVERGGCSFNAWTGPPEHKPKSARAVLPQKAYPHLYKLKDLAPGEVFGESVVFPQQRLGLLLLAEQDLALYRISKESFLLTIPSTVLHRLQDETAFRNAYMSERHKRMLQRRNQPLDLLTALRLPSLLGESKEASSAGSADAMPSPAEQPSDHDDALEQGLTVKGGIPRAASHQHLMSTSAPGKLAPLKTPRMPDAPNTNSGYHPLDRGGRRLRQSGLDVHGQLSSLNSELGRRLRPSLKEEATEATTPQNVGIQIAPRAQETREKTQRECHGRRNLFIAHGAAASKERCAGGAVDDERREAQKPGWKTTTGMVAEDAR
ncbi:hypothetical protein CYMTET_15852 [Cymbomonas tetramitiformis]|uniref:Cyclic nucleotide-binding domain-containing protein n=1 Tax=Cymbomonas tetramitiformis TaxID=36881 RepID=A0AAE0GEN3_9CHLO|nr:hypothetical protein CYMTET_15852 [Cymbomonas tetramitiformis]